MPGHAPLGHEDACILGYNVHRIRMQHGMSIAELARTCGLSRPTIYKIEDGLSNIKLSTISDIAQSLGVTAQDLLTPPDKAIPRSMYRELCQKNIEERLAKRYEQKIKKRLRADDERRDGQRD